MHRRRKNPVRSKTPISLKIEDKTTPKTSESTRNPRRSLNIQNQRPHKKNVLSNHKSKPKTKLESQRNSLQLSQIIDEYEIDFMTKHPKNSLSDYKSDQKFNHDKFQFISVIGCGLFGNVWKAKEKSTGMIYAIKQMSKAQIIAKKGLKICFNQRQILPELHFPLIPALHSAFQTQTDLYLIFTYLPGGDLRYHITKFKYFQEKQIRFFAACIIASLEYLYKKNILHRDLKPENLILDSEGYLCLADYGIASKADQKVWSQCGTTAYMSPEVLLGNQGSFEADYYGLGVILYEMIIGQRPYAASDKQELKYRMSKNSISIKKTNIPEGWSIESIDFMNRLLHRNRKNRLGFHGIHQLKNHAWLIDFPWQQLLNKKIKSPYLNPFKQWQIDYSKFTSPKIPQNQLIEIRNQLLKSNMQELFKNYNMVPIIDKSVGLSTKISLQIRK